MFKPVSRSRLPLTIMFPVSCCMVLVVLGLAATSMAKVYTVGDSAGWDVSADLESWPVNKTFFVGDILCKRVDGRPAKAKYLN